MAYETYPEHIDHVEPTASESEIVARWGGIVAGVFTVLALLVLLGQIGIAVGLSTYDAGDRAAPYGIGAGIWGMVAGILAFLGGGYVGARVARHVRRRTGAAQGFLVWAVAVPVIGVLGAILAIGTVTAAGVTTVAAVQADPAAAAEAREAARLAVAGTPATTPAVRPELNPNATAAATVENAAKTAAATGWAAVGAMLLSLGAAVLGGYLPTYRSTRVVTRRAVRTDGQLHVDRLPV